jgi:flagellar biosynthesis protein FliP
MSAGLVRMTQVPRRVLECRWLILFVVFGWLVPVTAWAQTTAPAATSQAARLDRLGQIARDAGLPSAVSGATGTSASDLSMPDLTRALPTTTDPEKLSSSIQILLLLSILALAPSILLMTTCFTRVIIVLSLLRQALGAAQLPPNQVLIGLALFITFLVMGPTWAKINTEALEPYRENRITQAEAFNRAVEVMRGFMIRQVVAAHDEDDVYLFHSYATKDATLPHQWSDVGTTSLIPAFILSELKVAFFMGFRIYLPFLIIDMVISSVLISIGMQLLPPVMVSLPFKLLLFVLVDGWHLVTATLLSSFN